MYRNNKNMVYVGSKIVLFRNCWHIQDLKPQDIHEVLRRMGINGSKNSKGYTQYSTGTIFTVTQGELSDYAEKLAKQVYSERKQQETNIQQNQTSTNQNNYIGRRYGESNISLDCLNQQDKDDEDDENKPEYLKESLGEKMYDPRKVKIVVKYLDNGFKRGTMSCIGGDGYPQSVKIVGMMGGDGNILKNMNHNQLFYLLQDRFNKIFDDGLLRDKFLKDIIKGWHDKNISKDGIIRIKKKK